MDPLLIISIICSLTSVCIRERGKTGSRQNLPIPFAQSRIGGRGTATLQITFVFRPVTDTPPTGCRRESIRRMAKVPTYAPPWWHRDIRHKKGYVDFQDVRTHRVARRDKKLLVRARYWLLTVGLGNPVVNFEKLTHFRFRRRLNVARGL